MTSKNIELKTGDIVKIENAYFKSDNGLYFVTNCPGDVNWLGDNYYLKKICKNGKLSKAKYSTCFWPLCSYVNDRKKAAEANTWNKENATIAKIDNVNTAFIIEYFEGKVEEFKEKYNHNAMYYGEEYKHTIIAKNTLAHYQNIIKRMACGDIQEEKKKATEEKPKKIKEEKRQGEEEYKKYLIEQEEKAYKECQKIEEVQKEEINNHIQIVDIAENEKYIISGFMVCGHGKECTIEELQNEGTEKEESALIKRELYFTDEKIYNNFCNMFLHDFDFLNGFGGAGTLDNIIKNENIIQSNSRQGENVKWILWDSVAVFLNGELKLVIDPEGFSYARYVNIVPTEYKKALLHNKEKANTFKTELKTEEVQQSERTYYPINEDMARLSRQMNSFTDYEKGSATEEYKQHCDKAYSILDKIKSEKPEQAECAKKKVNYYCRKLAEYYNDYYRNEASCPSILISGAGNFPTRKKERQNSRRETLRKTWDYLENYLKKIEDILYNEQPVKLSDSDAIEKLTTKIQQLEKEHKMHMACNAYCKKNGTLKGFSSLEELEEKEVAYIENSLKKSPAFMPFITYNETANIRRYKKQLEKLVKEKETGTTEQAEVDNENNKLFTIVENKEIMCLQILFDGIPPVNARDILKSNGFRWSPKNKAWQRQLTDNARYIYNSIKDKLKSAMVA